MRTKYKTNPWVFILMSGLLYLAAQSLTRPLIALYAKSLGLTEVEIGVVVGIFAALPFLLAIPSGGLADTIGRVRILRIGTFFMFISGIFYMISTNIYFLIIAQIIAGLGQMTVWLVIQVMITDEKQNQSARIASFSVYNTVGQMMGPLIGGFLAERYNMTISFSVYTFISLLLIVLFFQLIEPKNKLDINEKMSVKNMYIKSFMLLKNVGIIATLLCTFIALFILDVRVTFLPIYLHNIDISPLKIGILLSLGTSSALLIKPIYPALIKILGLRVLLIVTFVISLSLLFITPFLSNFTSFVVLLLFSGLALGINQPLSLSMISDQTNTNERGIAVGLRLMANRLSQLIDPLLFGFLTMIISMKFVFIVVGLFLLVLSIITFLLLKLEERKRQITSINNDKVIYD